MPSATATTLTSMKELGGFFGNSTSLIWAQPKPKPGRRSKNAKATEEGTLVVAVVLDTAGQVTLNTAKDGAPEQLRANNAGDYLVAELDTTHVTPKLETCQLVSPADWQAKYEVFERTAKDK